MLDVDGMIAVVLTFDFEALDVDQIECGPRMSAEVETHIFLDGIII